MDKVICLVPGCTADEFSRGLCVTHYQNARRLIKRGKTSWEKLESLGKSVGRKNKERGATAFFLDETVNIKE